MRYVNYFFGSRDNAMRTRHLQTRFAYVMRVDCRPKVTYAAAKMAVRKVAGERERPATIADNAKALG
jgi:hypothetical protein